MNIGIIGSGTMGSGIAQVAATAHYKVTIYDQNEKALKTSEQNLLKVMSRLVEKGKLGVAEATELQERIRYSTKIDNLRGADIVIEAIVENIDIKKQVFTKLEGIVSQDCVIASNTSSLSITSLAACIQKPERFIGIHFFNPAPLMKLVEVIPAIQTNEDTIQRTKAILAFWNKIVVSCKDTPGFIVNKVARPFYGESLKMLEEGIADAATIDWAMKTLGGFRMGPFELMDFIGNDVNYAVTETVFTAFYYDSRYKPAFTQMRLAEAGFLGRKTGRGYYQYGEGIEMPEPTKDPKLGAYLFNRVLSMLINEAADTLFTGIANKEDIDLAMVNGVNYPKGLLSWADEIGIQECVNSLDQLYDEYREDRYRCCPLLRKMATSNQTFF